jgi:ribosomal protein L14E/L6E/L27E
MKNDKLIDSVSFKFNGTEYEINADFSKSLLSQKITDFYDLEIIESVILNDKVLGKNENSYLNQLKCKSVWIMGQKDILVAEAKQKNEKHEKRLKTLKDKDRIVKVEKLIKKNEQKARAFIDDKENTDHLELVENAIYDAETFDDFEIMNKEEAENYNQETLGFLEMFSLGIYYGVQIDDKFIDLVKASLLLDGNRNKELVNTVAKAIIDFKKKKGYSI